MDFFEDYDNMEADDLRWVVHTPKLGCLSKSCRCVLKYDKVVNIPLLRLEAETGVDGFAQLELARCYDFGIGVYVDEEQATVWYKRSVESGNTCAMYILGARQLYHVQNEEDYGPCFDLIQKSARHGNAVAQFWNGSHLLGKYMRVEAASEFTLAALQGHVEAMIMLAKLYRDGRDVGVDPIRSAELYRRSSDAGNMEGLYELSVCYRYGSGVPADATDSIRLIRLWEARKT
jgi:uncharacterized protein